MRTSVLVDLQRGYSSSARSLVVEYERLMAFYFNDQSDMGIHDGGFSNFGWKNETSVW